MNPEIRKAAEILRAGGLVAFPTETVYGLGADGFERRGDGASLCDQGAPRGPSGHRPLQFEEKAFSWAREVPEAARQLADRFWPGPLTLILKRSKLAKDFVTGGQDSVGLRVPSHPVAHELLTVFQNGIAAPSANRFGLVSPTTAAHVRADLGDDVDLVLEGGPSEVGIESTIVDLSTDLPCCCGQERSHARISSSC